LLYDPERTIDMTLDEAIAAVEATLDSPYLRVDRRQAREDSTSYLLIVLDTSGGRRDDGGPVANGPRLVAKASGEVSRLTVPDAVARAERMALVRR
jgi:hypothetical protein